MLVAVYDSAIEAAREKGREMAAGQIGAMVETFGFVAAQGAVAALDCVIREGGSSAPLMHEALKAMDASMTLGWTDPSHADARRELGSEMCEIWIKVRSALSQAKAE